MRILLLHNRYRTGGGEEQHLDLLEQGLTAHGVDVDRFEVVSPSEPGIWRRMTIAAGLVYRPSSRRTVGEVLRVQRPDLVHAHNLMPLLTPSVLHEAQRQGARVVLTAHNYRLFCPSGTLLRGGRLHEDCVTGSSLLCGLRGARDSYAESVAYGVALSAHRSLRFIDRWVDAIITPSEHLCATLVRAGLPRERLHVVRFGVRVNGWSPHVGQYGLYAGRLSPEKGLPVLMEALRVSRVPLRIAGQGPLLPQVLEAAAAADTLEYVGHLSPPALTKLRRQAAFVVVPSVGPDVSPFTALEALADGIPVIASAIGGLGEIVDKPQFGTLVPPGDSAALAEAMADWWSRRELGTVEHGAWTRARERFDLVRQARETLDLYRSVLETT
jgi:glycosyltransferase involved in cell wall biosynthesis